MKHTKQAFATVCGIKTKDLSVYIGRGQVVVEGEEIDIENPINKVFLEKRLSKKKNHLPAKQAKASTTPNVATESAISEGMSLTEIQKRKKLADLKKVGQETELLKLREMKIKNEIVPVEDVKNVFLQFRHHVSNATKDAIEQMLIETAEESRWSNEVFAKKRKRLIEVMNRSIITAAEMTKRSIGIVTQNYAESKEVGEHD